MNKTKVFVKILTTSSLFVLLVACSMFSGRETVGEYVDDGTITSKVKAEILADASLKVFQINVETMQGIVQLSGFIDTQATEKRAMAIAYQVHGVKAVQDNLIIHDTQ